MANPEHVAKLGEGVEAFNLWREGNPGVRPDFRGKSLEGADLKGIDLSSGRLQGAKLHNVNLFGSDLQRANLQGAKLEAVTLVSSKLARSTLARAGLVSCDLFRVSLRNANLCEASLRRANLLEADLSRCNFVGANAEGANLKKAKLAVSNLRQCDLRGTVLEGADLRGVGLYRADLGGAGLVGATLTGADVRKAKFVAADLRGVTFQEVKAEEADFSRSIMGRTTIVDSNLSRAIGLETVVHYSSSNLGLEVLEKSGGRFPGSFLRGCGLSDWVIESSMLYDPCLTESERIDLAYRIVRILGESPIAINSLFVSYNREDNDFVDAIGKALDGKRVRYWRDANDALAGKLESQVDRAMRLNPTVLLVLSENSVESDWVEWEVEKARELEKELKRDVLCPIALDRAWEDCGWDGRLMKQVKKYNILDFSRWRELEEFEKQFQKLIDGLGLFYPRG